MTDSEIQDWFDEHESPKEIGGIRRDSMPSRGQIIDVLAATRGLSEGVTADAILATMRVQP